MIALIKKNKTVLAVFLVILIVVAVFATGGDKEESMSVVSDIEMTVAPAVEATELPAGTILPEATVSPEKTAKPDKTALPEKTDVPNSAADIQHESKSEAVTETAESYSLGEEKTHSTNVIKYTSENNSNISECTISIYCKTLLTNMDNLDKGKHQLVPSDGCILKAVKVRVEDGDNVFDILKKATRDNKIHMEYVNTPIYNSAYIEGIHNLYEFDCGELSGWMYSVNGDFPNYGCSSCAVKPGDVIEWHYTCDLGRDVSGRVLSQRDE